MCHFADDFPSATQDQVQFTKWAVMYSMNSCEGPWERKQSKREAIFIIITELFYRSFYFAVADIRNGLERNSFITFIFLLIIVWFFLILSKDSKIKDKV
jgi:hypothetical protein